MPRLSRQQRRERLRYAIIPGAATCLEPLENRLLLSAAPPTISLSQDPTGISSQLLALTQPAPQPASQTSATQPASQTSATQPASQPAKTTPAGQGGLQFSYDSSGRVAVHITAKNVAALTTPLQHLGFVPVASVPSKHFVDGFIPVASIDGFQALQSHGLLGVMPIYKPMTSAGAVESQGDNVLEADRARLASGFDGTGVTVGVLSDSYNNLGGASTDVATGDLPSNVRVLQDETSGGTDEGRAMMQIVHDLAPGANLAFATAEYGDAAFAQNIANLAKPIAQGGAGASVITDDVYYFDEPFFQDGVIAQAVNNVVNNSNVAYFSAAGNLDTQAYDSTSVNFMTDTIPGISGSPASYYNFNPAGPASDRESFSLSTSGTSGVVITLQWDQPFYTASGVTTNLTAYIIDDGTGAVVASSTANAIANQAPIQILGYKTTSSTPKTYDLVIQDSAGAAPGEIKFVNYGANEYGDAVFTYATNSPTIVPHAGATGAMAVAAAAFYQQRSPEPFTSAGPVKILFDASSYRLASAQIRSKPDFMATDGDDTTFFGQDVDGNGRKNFFGTSAAAPHGAAIAALIRQANPSWTPAQVYADLKSTADPTGSNGTPNSANLAGAGLIDAYRAVVGLPIAASQPLGDGFESGVLSQNWQTFDSGAGRSLVLAGNGPSSGSYQLVEDGNLNGFSVANLSESTLNINLAGAGSFNLSFDFKSFPNGYQTNQPMPASFIGHGNYDGVALSVDGTHWYRLQSLLVSTTSYTTYTINLSTFASSNGLTLSADTQIKFQHYDPDTFTAPNGGFAFDNVIVAPTPAPMTLSGASFYLRRDNANPVLPMLDVWTNATGAGNPNQQTPLISITSLAINGTSASDSLIVSFANGNPLPTSGATFTGGAGTNALGLIDDNSGDTVTLNDTGATLTSPAFGSTTIALAGAGNFAVTVTGGSGNDLLIQQQSSGKPSPTFAGGAGNDQLIVNTNYTFNADASASNSHLSVQVNSGASTAFNTTQHLASLSIASGNAVLNAGILVTGSLTISGTGKLDLKTGKMIVHAGNLGTFSSGAYNGLTGLIASAYASNAWSGNGITTSSATPGSTLTSLGIATADQLGKVGQTFSGETLASGDVIVMYTYGGDANLDGKINIDDYGRIDSNVGQSGSVFGWFNGDFNYDGKINIDDYGIIDSNIGRQGAPFPTIVTATPALVSADGASKKTDRVIDQINP